MASQVLYKSLLLSAVLLVMSACGGVEKRLDAETIGERQATVRGSAAITDAGIDQARQDAINDAISNASSQLKKPNSGALLVSDVKVVDEWQEGTIYHVQALAVLSQSQACRSPYRKKIVATAFPIMNPDQVSGIESQDLFSGIPREINNRLMESGDFVGRNMTNSVLYLRPDVAPEVNVDGRIGAPVILDIARRQDAQFVLSGVIRDFKIESTDYIRGAGPLSMLKSTMRDFIARRSVGIDVFVHDGFTGALLFQHRYTDSILGDVTLPSGYTVGSERFDSTSAGHKITEIIDQASEDIRKLFGCYPFAARISRVENNRIYLAAGAQDKVKVGDRFKVYSATAADSIGMGFTDPIGMMTISDVGPSMAAGNMESTSRGIVRPGDWVRSFATP
jgi:hypothetical protein